ncbi:hypothetical protein ABKN59_001139 [Abortiporus biennis]
MLLREYRRIFIKILRFFNSLPSKLFRFAKVGILKAVTIIILISWSYISRHHCAQKKSSRQYVAYCTTSREIIPDRTGIAGIEYFNDDE